MMGEHFFLFKLAGIIWKWLSEWWDGKKKLAEQLAAHKRHILNVAIVNDYPVELSKFRGFLLETGLSEKPSFKKFFANWLVNPFVVQGKPALNVFSNEELAELRTELIALTL